MPIDHLRVASLQYAIRPLDRDHGFDEFVRQASDWVKNAADYKAWLVLFPEYFSLQLLSLLDPALPLPEQIRRVAGYRDRFVELFAALARRHQIMIVAGSIPVSGSPEAHSSVFNECHVFAPDGKMGVQRKNQLTRFEREDFQLTPTLAKKITVFEASWGRFAVAICYDVEFPELVRAAALNGAKLLLVPSCTDDRQGYFRVRYCAQARAIENQIYVAQSCTVGGLPNVAAACLNYGQSALYTPSDYGFARDGILQEATPNTESMVVGDFNLSLLDSSRADGTVLPLLDIRNEGTPAPEIDVVQLG